MADFQHVLTFAKYKKGNREACQALFPFSSYIHSSPYICLILSSPFDLPLTFSNHMGIKAAPAFAIMRCATYLILFYIALVSSHAVSLPQATPLPQRRGLGNLTFHNDMIANTTVNDFGNSSASGNTFDMRLDSLGGTITMNVGPLSVFTQTTVSKTTLS